MKQTPKISIITVCYNSAGTIEDTLKSVTAQDYENVEYLIIDGKSKDNTLDIVEKYRNKIATVVSEKDGGIFYAFNKGVKLATGDYVGIINSDDVYVSKTVLRHVVETFQKTGADAVYGDLVCCDWDDLTKVTRFYKSGKYNKNRLKYGWMPPHPAFFVKRELYEKYGDFNTIMKISNDYELVLRFLYKYSATAAYLPEVLIKMREGGNSSGGIKRRIKANQEDQESWEMNGYKMPMFFVLLKRLRKIPQFFVFPWLSKRLGNFDFNNEKPAVL